MQSIYHIMQVAGRHMVRQSLNTAIGLVGLTIGFTVALIALLYVWAETHYDDHIPNVDRLYILDATVSLAGRTPYVNGRLPGALAPSLLATYPDVEQVTRLWRQYSTVQLDDRLDFYDITGSADRNFVDLMGMQLVSGSFEALDDPSQVLVSATMGARLFEGADPLGQTFKIEGRDVQVGGVFADIPRESHLDMSILSGLDGVFNRRRNQIDGVWSAPQVYTYALLREGADAANLQAGAQQLMQDNFQLGGQLPANKAFADVISMNVHPIAGLHLSGPSYPFGFKPVADHLRMQVLVAIAALIVVIACVNYINLSTVRAMDRAREVAMRKILGAGRRQLVLQFLAETALLAGLAFIAALALVEISAGLAGDLIGAELNQAWLLDPYVLGLIGGLFGLVVLLSGLYPALVASAYRPGRLLAENSRGARGSRLLRQSLVVFQFAASIVLAISAVLIAQQLNYARTNDVGYDADNVMIIYGIQRGPKRTISLTRSLDRAISGRPGVEMVSASSHAPGWSMGEAVIRAEGSPASENRMLDSMSIDLDFFQAMGVKPLAGRLLDPDFAGDAIHWDLEKRDDAVLPLVINEAAVEALNFMSPLQALDQLMVLPVQGSDTQRKAKIVGVVPDIHLQSLRVAIKPMIFYPDPTRFNTLLIRIDAGQREVALQSIADGWKSVHSDSLSMESVAATLADQYAAEENELNTVAVLAALGILIAMFGQYGLAAHSAQSRKREISIRKVLGADVPDILRLFIWQFSKPVLVATAVAWPVAYILGSQWLENFVYRIAINPLWFAAVGAAVLALALGAVAGHALSASHTSPANALRQD